MKKVLILLFAIISVTMAINTMGCSKLFGGRRVVYRVSSGQGQTSGQTVFISYINEDGENEFDEVAPGFAWSWSGDFKEGDWVRLQAQCGASTGNMQISISCDDGDNDKILEKVELKDRNIIEASMTLN